MSSDKAALSIAGSDPSGGAGIQADLKTFAALQVYGGAAITCLTAQNSLGVTSFRAVDPGFVTEQIRLVLADLPVTHIKTGMIGTAEVAVAVGKALKDFQGTIICDPVLRASDGKDLLEAQAVTTFKEQIIGQAAFLTPNIFELEMLTGYSCSNQEQTLEAGRSLIKEYPSLAGVILTGGHLEEDGDMVTDYFILRENSNDRLKTISAQHDRIKTRNTHGTGCTFSSAFTAYLLLTGDAEKSFHQAVSFMDRIIRKSAALCLGKGRGPLAHHLFKT